MRTTRVAIIATAMMLGITFCVYSQADKTVSSPLSNAYYAKNIPIYPSAIFEESVSGTTGDADGNIPSKHMSWFFKITVSRGKVVTYYEKNLKGAKKDVDADKVVFTITPPNAAPGELVCVVVSAGKLKISESVSIDRPTKY